LFAAGDCLFLIAVGVASTLVMHATHQLRWPFAVAGVLGMIAAMAVQTLMAYAVAPLLGSIESMVPSMVVGMISPLSVCALHGFGHEPGHAAAFAAGTVGGVAMCVFVRAYGTRVRRTLGQAYEHEGGARA